MNHHSMQFSAMEQKQISFEESNWMDNTYFFLVAISQQRIYSLTLFLPYNQPIYECHVTTAGRNWVKSMLTLIIKDRVSDKNCTLVTFVIHFSIVLLYIKVYIKQNNWEVFTKEEQNFCQNILKIPAVFFHSSLVFLLIQSLILLGSYFTYWSYKCFSPYFLINQYVYL